ncbi:MAG: rhodanese-like domain-containing protein [Bacteroidota bacterium]|nr:rhodanese-like domain-containing protein [Bacteroidota bacterium]
MYCQSGNRSQRAARKLVKMGFTEVYDLRGGYRTWSY